MSLISSKVGDVDVSKVRRRSHSGAVNREVANVAPEIRAWRCGPSPHMTDAERGYYPAFTRVTGVGFPIDRMNGVERYIHRLREWVRSVAPDHPAYGPIRRAVRGNVVEARLAGFRV